MMSDIKIKNPPKIRIKPVFDSELICPDWRQAKSKSDGLIVAKRKKTSNIIENSHMKKLRNESNYVDEQLEGGVDLGGYYLVISPKSENFPILDLNKFYTVMINEYDEICQDTPYLTNKMNFDEKIIKFPSACCNENYRKNRYNDILCNEKTRFKYRNGDENSVDDSFDEKKYINANNITGVHQCNSKFIATQAPLEETLPEFYEMIWQSKTFIIITLSSIIEAGRTKMFQFWPEKNQSLNYGHFLITSEEEEDYGKKLLHRKLSITNLENDTKRIIYQLHYTGWPDNGVPSEPSSLIEIFKLHKSFEQEGLKQGLNGPAVVHCSAGIGRTATYMSFVFGAQIMDHLKNSNLSFDDNLLNSHIDVPLIVNNIRKQRSGSIQNWEQYAFVYKALNYYLMQLCL